MFTFCSPTPDAVSVPKWRTLAAPPRLGRGEARDPNLEDKIIHKH